MECIIVWCTVVHEFLVSKETVVLRRWERSKQKFGFIKRVDKTKFLYSGTVWHHCFAQCFVPLQRISLAATNEIIVFLLFLFLLCKDFKSH